MYGTVHMDLGSELVTIESAFFCCSSTAIVGSVQSA
jgi:hypothetical protein